MKTLRVFHQEAWHEQLPVGIHEGANVSVNGVFVETPREQAMAWTILRLNAQSLHFQHEAKELKKLLDKTHASMLTYRFLSKGRKRKLKETKKSLDVSKGI